MNAIRLARPNEVSKLKAAGYKESGPSIFPNFVTMTLVEFDQPFVPDEETAQLERAVAALGDGT